MANQLREAKVFSIKTLHEQGWSQRRIARELGINGESLARYLKQDSKPAILSKAPTGSRSLCEPYQEVILCWLEQGLSAGCTRTWSFSMVSAAATQAFAGMSANSETKRRCRFGGSKSGLKKKLRSTLEPVPR